MPRRRAAELSPPSGRRPALWACLGSLLAGILLFGADYDLAARPGQAKPKAPAPEAIVSSAPEAGTAFIMKRLDSVLLARNFDGPSGDALLFVNKRGVDKEAFGSTAAEPLRWRSKYGSVTFNRLGREFPLGGVNEAGLAVEALRGSAAYPVPDARPALNELQWVQYQLDNHGSVKDVLKSDRELRVSKLLFDLHYLVADRKGQIAVVEFVAGKTVAYMAESLAVPVLANDGYAESVKRLGSHRYFGGDKASPAGSDSAERFVRAAASLREYGWLGRRPSIDDAFVVLRAVSRDDTQWSVAYNLPRQVILFKTRANRRYRIVRLDRFDFSCRAPALMLAVGAEGSWDLSEDFKPYDRDLNRTLLESVFKRLVEAREIAAPPPAELVAKLAAYPDACLCGRSK